MTKPGKAYSRAIHPSMPIMARWRGDGPTPGRACVFEGNRSSEDGEEGRTRLLEGIRRETRQTEMDRGWPKRRWVTGRETRPVSRVRRLREARADRGTCPNPAHGGARYQGR